MAAKKAPICAEETCCSMGNSSRRVCRIFSSTGPGCGSPGFLPNGRDWCGPVQTRAWASRTSALGPGNECVFGARVIGRTRVGSAGRYFWKGSSGPHFVKPDLLWICCRPKCPGSVKGARVFPLCSENERFLCFAPCSERLDPVRRKRLAYKKIKVEIFEHNRKWEGGY